MLKTIQSVGSFFPSSCAEFEPLATSIGGKKGGRRIMRRNRIDPMYDVVKMATKMFFYLSIGI